MKTKFTSPNFSQNNFTKNFSRDFHKKSFRHTRQPPGSRSSKNAASPLSREFLHPIPASCGRPKKTGTKNSPSFHSGIVQPIRALPAPPKTSRDRPPCQRTFSRAAANERGGEPEQPLAPEYHDKPGASSSQQGNQKKQRDDMKRAGVQ